MGLRHETPLFKRRLVSHLVVMDLGVDQSPTLTPIWLGARIRRRRSHSCRGSRFGNHRRRRRQWSRPEIRVRIRFLVRSLPVFGPFPLGLFRYVTERSLFVPSTLLRIL